MRIAEFGMRNAECGFREGQTVKKHRVLEKGINVDGVGRWEPGKIVSGLSAADAAHLLAEGLIEEVKTIHSAKTPRTARPAKKKTVRR